MKDEVTEESQDDAAHDFWKVELKKLLDMEVAPSELISHAAIHLSGLPCLFSKAVGAMELSENGEGEPHRTAEVRRLLPVHRGAVRHYCSKLPGNVGSWVCLMVDVLNHMYLGGKRVMGRKVLSDSQRCALEMLILEVENFVEKESAVKRYEELWHDLGRVRFDYSGEPDSYNGRT